MDFPNIYTAKTPEDFQSIADFNNSLVFDHKIMVILLHTIGELGKVAYDATGNEDFLHRSRGILETMENASKQYEEFLDTLAEFYPEVFPTREQFEAKYKEL